MVPTKPEELAEEGINLSHCVGQYVDRVAGGECHILFRRFLVQWGREKDIQIAV